MEKIDFIAGSEKRFSDFISGLGKENIALISHVDLDGITAGKVANDVLQANLLKFVNYEDLNDSLVKELKKNKVKKIVFADLLIKDKNFVKSLEKFADILIIDHHLFTEDFNSDKTVFLNTQGYCSAYICYYLFSKVQNLEKRDWLVAVASIADWCYDKNSKWMQGVYEKYGDEFIPTIEGIKRGKIWKVVSDLSSALIYFKENTRKVYDSIGENFGDIGDLGKHATEVQKEIEDKTKEFYKKREDFSNGYFWEFESKFPIKSDLITGLSARVQDKTLILARAEGKYYSLSARRQDGKINVADFLGDLVKGLEGASAGGHFKAAGGSVLLKDREKLKKKLLGL